MCREEMKVCVRGITQFHVSSLQARLVSDIFRAYGSRQDPPHCKTPWQQSARASLHTVCAAEMQTHLFKTSWNSAMLTECTPLGFHSLFFLYFVLWQRKWVFDPKTGRISLFHTAAYWVDIYLKLFLSEQNYLLVPQNGTMPRDRFW